MISFELLTAQEMYKHFKVHKEKEGIKYYDTDDLDHQWEWNKRIKEKRGLYLVALDSLGPSKKLSDQRLIAVRKFYHWKDRESELKQGMKAWDAHFRGNLYLTGYIAVHPDYQRRRIAFEMQDHLMGLIRPGDIIQTSSHAGPGEKLNKAWAQANKTQYNYMFGEGYSGAAESYDPKKKNFWMPDLQLKLGGRPIQIDKGKIRQLSQKILQELPGHLRNIGDGSPNLPVFQQRRFNANNWKWHVSNYDYRDVQGVKHSIPIFIKFKEPKNWRNKYIVGGSMSSSYKKGIRKGVPKKITINLNYNLTPKEFNTKIPRLKKELYFVLIHEITHATDFMRKPSYQAGASESNDPEAISKYLNDPHEVRAYMQEIVDEVLTVTEASIKDTEGWGDFTSSDYIWKVLFEKSLVWARLKPVLTENNKKKILKAVARALEDNVPKWLEKYKVDWDWEDEGMKKKAGQIVKFPTRNLITIGGRKYLLSQESGLGGKSSRFSFLWAYDEDKKIIASWRVSDGENKHYETISTFNKRTLSVLDKARELNKVSHRDFIKIEKEMTRRNRDLLQTLQEEMKANESQAEQDFRWVATEYWNKIVALFFQEAIRRYKGTIPVGFKYQPTSRLSKNKQIVAYILWKVREKYWTEEFIMKYAKKRNTPSHPLNLEGLGMQDPYFIMNDLVQDLEDQLLMRGFRDYAR